MDINPYTKIIDEFLQEKLEAKLAVIDKKLDKATDDELADALREKKQELRSHHQRTTWIADAAKRVSQLSLVSHAAKFTHPDAKGLRGIYHANAPTKPAGLVVSTPSAPNADVVGNAAALDVNAFLSLDVGSKTILDALEENDPDVLEALAPEAEVAGDLRDTFLAIKSAPAAPATHSNAKQVYFPVGTNDYHLLTPLFPTSLYHRLDSAIQEEKFGEHAKAAREAKKREKPFDRGYRYHPRLAVRQHGGSNQQNISQLNAKRGGRNYLLASFPPQWKRSGLKPPAHVRSIFGRWLEGFSSFRELISGYRRFIHKTPPERNNLELRNKSRDFVQQIIDEVLMLAAQVQRLEPGWSSDAECSLNPDEQFWLDPGRAQSDGAWRLERESGDWPTQVRKTFGQYLNHKLGSDERPMGDPESSFFAKVLREELDSVERELRDAF